MIVKEKKYLAHYGILRRSGRYPWGSGGNVESRSRSFLSTVAELKKAGMSDKDIYESYEMTSTEYRNLRQYARNAAKQANISQATKLKDKGLSNGAIAERMGLKGESSVRALLKDGENDRAQVIDSIANMLQRHVDTKGPVDVGLGVETQLGVSKEKLSTATFVLKQKGYVVHPVQVDTGTDANKVVLKVLAPPGTTYRDLKDNKSAITQLRESSDDGGRSFFGLLPPISIDSKRVSVKYAEQGGDKLDGIIYVRPGAKELSLGKARYAQVRIMVDGTHYIKGVAMYKDDLPHGTDLMFHTAKSNTGNKLDALKELKDDPDNPFGSMVRQLKEIGADGKEKLTSAMNLVNEEGDWERWKDTISSQVLSKQPPALAKRQLDLAQQSRRETLDEIMHLTNPAVRRKLLESFADTVDSASWQLKAASFPRQANHLILPIDTLKETEVYAPKFRDGEQVALVRFPHGGKFEIPVLTVNNKHPEASRLIGPQAPDAIGINHKVAKRLSGADFDGDTVLVIPQVRGRALRTEPALKGLENFDAKRTYPPYDGMKTIDGGTYNATTGKVEFPPGKRSSPRGKGTQMGLVSNLVSDMTIKGATNSEIAQAVRHSMVVIDAEKHHLDFKRSAVENGISALMKKYQGRAQGGGSTLISRRGSTVNVPDRKRHFGVDPNTGEKVHVLTGKTLPDGTTKYVKVRQLQEVKDAHELSSGTPVEKVYADHVNQLKALANEARRAAVNTPPHRYDPASARAYAKQVSTLTGKLNDALKNKPLERHARLMAETTVSLKKAANPEMDKAELKKIRAAALEEARTRTGVRRTKFDIEPDEWHAIQAGAITAHKLRQILDVANPESVKKLATPRTTILMTTTKVARARLMVASGYTQAEIADALGVSLTTLKTSLRESS